MATPTKFFAFGFSGIDIEVNQHIQTNLVFAIANAKLEWLAWYIYIQNMLLWRWEEEFIKAGNANLAMGAKYDPNKDERIKLFAMSKSPLAWPFETSEVSSLVRFSDKEVRGNYVGKTGVVRLSDVGPKTNCNIWIDTGRNGTRFTFDLDKVASRRGFDYRGEGRVLRLAVERFNLGKLAGPTGGPPRMTEAGEDPAHNIF